MSKFCTVCTRYPHPFIGRRTVQSALSQTAVTHLPSPANPAFIHKSRTAPLYIPLLILYFPPSLTQMLSKPSCCGFFLNFAICQANHMADNAGEDPGRRSHKGSVENRTAACQDVATLAKRTPPAMTPACFLTATADKALCEQEDISNAVVQSKRDAHNSQSFTKARLVSGVRQDSVFTAHAHTSFLSAAPLLTVLAKPGSGGQTKLLSDDCSRFRKTEAGGRTPLSLPYKQAGIKQSLPSSRTGQFHGALK